MDWIFAHEGLVRLAIFAGVLAVMALAETLAPRRARVLTRRRRWPANLALVFIDTLALRFAMPLLAVGAAEIATARGLGVFNALDTPDWTAFLIAFLALDLAIYAQHIATHKIPALWALHKVHHADRDLDATTGFRFHPIEIMLSMVWKIAVIAMLGAPAAAVIVFEIALNAGAIFNHANLALPAPVERVVRAVIVTPDMHRVHHSVIRAERDSNYGFFLSIWDRLFGTYRDQPRRGHDGMTIGLGDHQTDAPASLWWSLVAPFQKSAPED